VILLFAVELWGLGILFKGGEGRKERALQNEGGGFSKPFHSGGSLRLVASPPLESFEGFKPSIV